MNAGKKLSVPIGDTTMLKSWLLIIAAYVVAAGVTIGLAFWLHASPPLLIVAAADAKASFGICPLVQKSITRRP